MISRTARRRIKKCLLWMEVLFILVLGAAVGVFAGAFYQISKVLPPQSYLKQYKAPAGTTIWSSDKVLLARLATENREPVPLERVPQLVQHAVVDTEDSRFYKHSGVDLRGIARALFVNVRGGDMNQQGASTLTQQLAREIYLTKARTLSRKLKEALLAIQIERNWTKQQILEMYLNQVYYGSGAYGIESASKVYFGKDVKKLTLPEAATLAGLPQRPSHLSPYVTQERDGNMNATIARRNQVLQRMADMGHITPNEAREAMRAPMKLAHKKAPQLGGYLHANHFVEYVVRHLRETYGDDMLFKGGLNVVTTLNYKMQREAERAARAGVRRGRGNRISEVALVAIEPQTGYVRAMVGGVQEPWEKYQFNCAVQAKRSPGSSFKAFVYAAALEAGWTPYRAISAYFKPIKDGNKIWAPKNHGGSGGATSLVNAFANSLNTCAVNLNMIIGPKNVVDMAHRLGVKSTLMPVPSLALGTSEVSVLEMAAAYSVFANKGDRADPQPVLKITNSDGSLIEYNPPRITREVLTPKVVQDMSVLTRAVVTSGTGRAALSVPNAHGKTGTGEEHRDLWFVGYTPELSTAVWAGNRDNSRMAHIFGGGVCTPIWADFMRAAVPIAQKTQKKPPASDGKPKPSKNDAKPADKPSGDNTDSGAQPGATPAGQGDDDSFQAITTLGGSRENMLRVKICTDSESLATPYCPNIETRPYFSGQQPAIRCSQHGPPAGEAIQRIKATGRMRSGYLPGDPNAPRRRRRSTTRTPRPPATTDAAPTDGGTTDGDGGGGGTPDGGTSGGGTTPENP